MITKIVYAFLLFICCTPLYSQVPVAHEDIPTEARHFLAKYFDSPFDHATKEVKRNSIAYNVVLDDFTEIEFSESGRWIEVDGQGYPIPYTFIHKKILDHVKKKSDDGAIVKIEISNSQYIVELSNGLDLFFDSKGNFRNEY